MITPVFICDSHAIWNPVGVEESLAAVHARVPSSLVSYLPHLELRADPDTNRVDLPPSMRPDMVKHLPPVVYHHAMLAAGLWWQQFWAWYLYNPWSIAGVGKHEGDWEFVQIATLDKAGDQPVLLTYSQHHSGGKREAWAHDQQQNGRPHVYVALGSHANYFNAGATLGGGIDRCDGRGQVIADYELREFGPWAAWSGLWGNSTGEGRSPQSPARQVVRWRTPHVFHSNAHAQ